MPPLPGAVPDAGTGPLSRPGLGSVAQGADAGGVSGEVVSEFLADAGDGWLSLLEVEWELPAGGEGYLCARATVPRDAYLHEFSPLIPPGTHHNGLSMHPAGEAPDGVVACASEISGRQIFASGVGTQNMLLPDGIAMQVRAGEQMVLNLHLFNSDDKALEGRSGVRVHPMDAADVKDVAEIVLGGPLSLEIPPGGPTKQAGQCTFDHDATIFSIAPHMHRLGVHALITAGAPGAGAVTLYDGPYEFDSQKRYPVDFVQLNAGDVVHVECTYQNDTDASVSFGMSTRDEMCFASMMRFPTTSGSVYLCTN